MRPHMRRLGYPRTEPTTCVCVSSGLRAETRHLPGAASGTRFIFAQKLLLQGSLCVSSRLLAFPEFRNVRRVILTYHISSDMDFIFFFRLAVVPAQRINHCVRGLRPLLTHLPHVVLKTVFYNAIVAIAGNRATDWQARGCGARRPCIRFACVRLEFDRPDVKLPDLCISICQTNRQTKRTTRRKGSALMMNDEQEK